MTASEREPNIIGLVCERAIEGEGTILDGHRLKELPNVKVVKFVCSGMIRPKMVENALKKGADGVFVTGCRFGDCTYRTGNHLIRDRLQGKRNPRLRGKRVDTDRVDMWYVSIADEEEFVAEARVFNEKVKDLNRQRDEAEETEAQSEGTEG